MKLIPYVSTHFRSLEYDSDVTPGRVYKIGGWFGENSLYFRDDVGDIRKWNADWNLEDATFEVNLDKILE